MVVPIKYPLDIPGVVPEDIKRTEGPRSKWMQLTCHWNKINENNVIVPHCIEPIINAKTEKLYVPDQKSDMAIKFLGMIIYTPIALIAKTVYHLVLPISLGHQIFLAVNKFKATEDAAQKNGAPHLAKRIVKVIIRNLIDIVKTPLYAIAMTVVALATIIFSIFKSTFLYEGRVAYGELLMSLNWGNKKSIWTITPCMVPIADLKKNEKKFNYTEEDKIYQGPQGTKIDALNNLARSLFNSRPATPAAA